MPQKQNNPNSKPSGYKKKQRRKTHRQNNLWKWIILGIAAIVIIVALILLIPRITGVPHISVAEAYLHGIVYSANRGLVIAGNISIL